MVSTYDGPGSNGGSWPVQGAEMVGAPAGTIDLRFGGSYRVA
jgi:hypothetical protein